MKKNKLLMPLAVFATLGTVAAPLATLTSCASKDPEKKEEFTVAFETFGGSHVDSIKVTSGNTINQPANPTKEFYQFQGWYEDQEFKQLHDWSEPVTSSFTLYAKFEFIGIASFEIIKQPVITDYFVNDTLKLAGLEVLGTLNDGTKVVLPSTAYSVTPAEGTILDTVGDIDCEVAIGQQKQIFQIHVIDPVVSVDFKVTRGLDDFQYGDLINRSDFVVTGKTYSGEEIELDDWEWFDEKGQKIEGDSYLLEPDQDKPYVNITLTYGVFKQTFTCLVAAASEIQLAMPSTVNLMQGEIKVSEEGTTVTKIITSQQTIKVVAGEGKAVVGATKLKYEIDPSTPDVIDIDSTTGVIKPHNEKPSAIQTAKVNVNWVGKTEDPLQITVRVIPTDADRIAHESKTALIPERVDFADYGKYTVDGVCTLPQKIMIGNDELSYTFVLNNYVKEELKAITQINLPKKTYLLPNSLFNGDGTKLQTITYDGAQDDWDYYVTQESSWYGKQAVGVECSDGLYLFTDCLDAKLQVIGQEEETPIYSVAAKTHISKGDYLRKTIRINYSELGFDFLASYHNVIGVLSSTAQLGDVRYDHVYLNGVELKKSEDEFSVVNGVLTLNPDKVTLTSTSNLVINVSSDPSEADQDLWIGCVPNFPVEIQVKPDPYRPSYKVGDKFKFEDGFEVRAYFSDRSYYIVPLEYIESTPAQGYTFAPTDVGTKTIEILDTITGLKTSYTVEVKAQ